MPYLFEMWGHPGHQLPPDGLWDTWLILGGRGAGKTRAGAEWIRSRLEGPTPMSAGVCKKAALVAASLDEARDVMALGDSGLMACTPPDRMPKWIEAKRTLQWPNGAEATCFSASSPDKLRGPQFDCAWADELAKWPSAREAWDTLQFSLRLGDHPQMVVTTTPRAIKLLEDLIENARTITTSAPTWANRANLAESFLRRVTDEYAGSSRGREELDGELVFDRPGAMWGRALLDAARARSGPEMQRIVVAVDPPVTSGENADECGIIVAGLGMPADGQMCGYILADRSSQGDTPERWARRAVDAYDEFGADRIVAEVNQGGELVSTLIRQVKPEVSFKAVSARRGKTVRAEPVSALYEQGRVKHLGSFPELEDQMRAFGSNDMSGSPDRVDALVWAITELMLTERRGAPRARSL